MIIGRAPNLPNGQEPLIQITYDLGIRGKKNHYVTADMEVFLKFLYLFQVVDTDIYLTDHCKWCNEADNNSKQRSMVDNCRDFLIQEIKLINPDIIVFNGKANAASEKKGYVTKEIRDFCSSNSIKLEDMWHCSALGRKFRKEDVKQKRNFILGLLESNKIVIL